MPEDQRPYSYVLNLDANGGTLDGESVKKYDYLGGADSGTSMPIYHYIPTRKGCKFKGWKSSKDGKGINYNYIYRGNWRADDKNEFDRDGLVQNGKMYSNLTLYADWEVVEPETTSENITEATTNMSETTSANGTETTTKKKTTKKKTITKLKANTYYFKVRAYKIVNGKTYYSEWSKVRKTIVKEELENNVAYHTYLLNCLLNEM